MFRFVSFLLIFFLHRAYALRILYSYIYNVCICTYHRLCNPPTRDFNGGQKLWGNYLDNRLKLRKVASHIFLRLLPNQTLLRLSQNLHFVELPLYGTDYMGKILVDRCTLYLLRIRSSIQSPVSASFVLHRCIFLCVIAVNIWELKSDMNVYFRC